MSRRPYIAALICVVIFSCLMTVAVEFLGRAHGANSPHPEWLHLTCMAAAFPGMFLSMILFGMCNTQTPLGYTVTIAFNAFLYAIPTICIVSTWRIHHRNSLSSAG